ncbi:MAG: TIGR04283 family arsenosugar biosynthesis glycosyltransferase [Deltaproteobacteria bacterium]|nr:TIGR04283 family arsenosugar biosynthesis glycosyltransferase [Deltaproteobacteria bacterium]
MRTSVIIPVLDEERVIEDRIAELDALAIDEIVVVDGGSGDGTVAAVARHPHVRLVRAPRGRAAQMNAGAALATGEVLVFLHADVALPYDARVQIARALDDPRVIAGAFRTWTVADRPTRLGPLLHLADLRSRYSSLPYGDQALFVRAPVFRAIGGFPPIALMEDLALGRRLREAGGVRIVPARVRVSGRRFIERPLTYTLLMNLYPALFRLGVSPALLSRFYGAVR